MSNAIQVISPYRHHGTWVFDDSTVGLAQEPFVAGIPEMIDVLVREIPDAQQGFRMLFSSGEFPGSQARFDRMHEEADGNWYRWAKHDMKGWLCPALFKYFSNAPDHLHIRVEPLQSTEQLTISVPRSMVEQLLLLLDSGDTAAARAMVAAALQSS